LNSLNEIFADPIILKVFHGSNSDIKWLQKDFGLYVVNLFDTYQAVQLLNKPPYGLSSLLFRYAKVATNKEFQLADWRLRPLTQDMVKYARRDTHYLLFIYDCLRKDILEGTTKESGLEKLQKVWNDSNKVALLKHSKPEQYSRQYWNLVGGQRLIWDDCKMEIFTNLWDWRNLIARKDDESEVYVMDNRLLMQIVNVGPESKEKLFGLRKNCPMKVVQYAEEICTRIRSVKENWANKIHEYKIRTVIFFPNKCLGCRNGSGEFIGDQ
jgi:exosome complex exonuclease RRP6